MDASKATLKRIKHLLNRLARADKLASDAWETEMDRLLAEIRELPREGLIQALDSAIGRSKSRKAAAFYVLAEYADIPEAMERIEIELSNPDPNVRRWLIQCISRHRLIQLASKLNDIMLNDPDELCRGFAIGAASHLLLPDSYHVIMQLAQVSKPDINIMWALVRYGREDSRAYFLDIFNTPIENNPDWLKYRDLTCPEALKGEMEWSAKKSYKVIAAWGLAKLGDKEAINYLGQMLYDPDIKGRNYYFHGVSLRAAQALADVFNVPFEWNKEYVETIRKWWEMNKAHILKDNI